MKYIASLLIVVFMLGSISTMALADQSIGFKVMGERRLVEMALDLNIVRLAMSSEISFAFSFIPLELVGYIPLTLVDNSAGGLGVNLGFGGGVELMYVRFFSASEWFTSAVGSAIFRLQFGRFGGFMKLDVSVQVKPQIANPTPIYRFGLGILF